MQIHDGAAYQEQAAWNCLANMDALTEQSLQAAEQIRSIINQVQKKSSEVLAYTGRLRIFWEHSSKLSAAFGDMDAAMKKLTGNIDSIVAQTRAISDAKEDTLNAVLAISPAIELNTAAAVCMGEGVEKQRDQIKNLPVCAENL